MGVNGPLERPRWGGKDLSQGKSFYQVTELDPSLQLHSSSVTLASHCPQPLSGLTGQLSLLAYLPCCAPSYL